MDQCSYPVRIRLICYFRCTRTVDDLMSCFQCSEARTGTLTGYTNSCLVQSNFTVGTGINNLAVLAQKLIYSRKVLRIGWNSSHNTLLIMLNYEECKCVKADSVFIIISCGTCGVTESQAALRFYPYCLQRWHPSSSFSVRLKHSLWPHPLALAFIAPCLCLLLLHGDRGT